MDIPHLAQETAKILAPFLPYLIAGGKEAAKAAFAKTGENFADAAWKKAEDLWGKIWGKAKKKEAAREAIEDAAQHPTDEDAQAAFRRQLIKLLEADEKLRDSVNLIIGGDVKDAQIAVGDRNIQIKDSPNAQIYVNPQFAGIPAQDIPDKELILAYLRSLASECSRLPLGVVDPRFLEKMQDDSLSLSGIYIDLDVQPPFEEGEEKHKAKEEFQFLERERNNRVPVMEALNDERLRHLVLLGDPGSGKTTCLHYITLALSLARQDDSAAENLLPEDWKLKKHFPVRLILRDVAAQHISADLKKGNADVVWNAIRADLVLRLGEEIAKSLFPKLQQFILKNPCLLMFDGLDEVTEADNRRERLIEAINAFCATMSKETCVLVTARPYAYTDPKWQLPRFKTLTLLPFNEEQVGRFVERWYQAMREVMKWDENTSNDKAQSLNGAVQEKEYLSDLAQRPLLLTLMVTLHTSWGKLPEDRADLYDETVRLLLDRWQRWREARDSQGNLVMEKSISAALSIEESSVRHALNTLAFNVHTRQGEDTQNRQNQPADIRTDEVLDAFSPYLPDTTHPRVIINYLETRAGLLLGLGNGIYAFPHRSFQEYLAACYLNDQPDPASEYSDRVLKDPAWWREVFLLGIGKMSRGGLGTALAALQTLLMNLPEGPDRADKDWQAFALAGQAITEMKLGADSSRYEKLIHSIRMPLVALVEGSHLTSRERAEAADTLARLGDPRFDAEGWQLPKEPLFGFVHIPAGDFLMGTREEDIKGLIEKFGGEENTYKDETPQHKITLPDYYMARYSVTTAQFKTFVEESGHKPDMEASLRGLPTRPAVYVTWYDAVAYCKWLDEKLKTAAPNRKGSNEAEENFWRGLESGRLTVTLPSEAEWEKAARGGLPPPLGRGAGGEVRNFPWGEDVNLDKVNGNMVIGRTSAVGAFPLGKSPYDLQDMSGNVWEWTRSNYKNYEYDPKDGRENMEAEKNVARVLRGGAYDSVGVNLRCAFRFGLSPYYRYHDFGFRCVVCASFPISP